VLTAEHRLGALPQPQPLGQGHEQVDRLAGQPAFRVVEVQVTGADGELGAAVGIIGEQLAQVRVLDPQVVLGQGAPLGGR
jgi:hypothetical protein